MISSDCYRTIIRDLLCKRRRRCTFKPFCKLFPLLRNTLEKTGASNYCQRITDIYKIYLLIYVIKLQ